MKPLINKIKVYVVGGDASYTRFIENCELTNSLEDAHVVLFTGGEDVSPELYGEQPHRTTYSNKSRDLYEKKIYESVKPGQLCVGICRGAQFLAVMNGSKLIQDTTGHAIRGTHTITNSTDFRRLPENVEITSTHHQMLLWDEGNNYCNLLYKSAKSLSDYYAGHDSRNLIEPEIYTYNETRDIRPICLCIQGHPEMMPLDSDAVTLCNTLINTYLGKRYSLDNKWYDFKYFSSNSKWSSDSPIDSLSIPFVDTWCFGPLFKEQFENISPTKPVEITYHIDTPTKWAYRETRNWCFLSKNDIVIYFEKLKKVHTFEYKISDYEAPDYLSGYRFDITINATIFWHKFLITMIRYTYMFPYNYVLQDALYLIKNGYNMYSIINILNVVSYTVKDILYLEEEYDFFHYTEDEDVIKYFSKATFYNKVECYLKKCEERDHYDNDDYHDDEENCFYIPTLREFAKSYGRVSNNKLGLKVINGGECRNFTCNYVFWTKTIDKRLPYYKENFKKFKSLK